MKRNNYDIFISYRREGGAQYARNLQFLLEKKGYKVFLDYDELVDGEFSPRIEAAIKASTIYILVLTNGSLNRCANEDDWVRREFEIAQNEGKRIIPVNADGTFDSIPESTPPHIKNAIESIQHSEIYFGQSLKVTVDQMVRDRIRPYVKRSWPTIPLVSIIVISFLALCVWGWNIKVKRDIRELKENIRFNGETIGWADDISKNQILTVDTLLQTISTIQGGRFTQGAVTVNGEYHQYVEEDFETPAFDTEVQTFGIGQYEITVGQWNTIMEDNREGDPHMPLANVTFAQTQDFVTRLSELTGLYFRLPTESEWEYAAKGGDHPEGFLFAGSDDPLEVAWFAKNSEGHAHHNRLATPTYHDLYDMSGNVSEWCDTDFIPYNTSVILPFDVSPKVIRGGNYDSEDYGITVTHREPALPDTSIPSLGFRVAMSL